MKIKIILGLLLMASLVVAGVSLSDKEITLSKDQKDALTSINLDYYDISDHTIGTEEMERCLKRVDTVAYDCFDEFGNITTCYKDYSRINTCKTFNTFWINCIEEDEETFECLNEEKIYYTDNEMKDILDSWEKKRIEGIADDEIDSNNKPIKEKVAEGVTTIK